MPIKKKTVAKQGGKNLDNKFILLVVILCLAAFFRFSNLETAPPGVFQDEAVNANDAISTIQAGDYPWEGWKAFYPANNGREGLFMNLLSLSFYFLGISVYALRFIPALFGLLTVLGVFLLARQLFKNYFIAYLSSFFIAISFWHVNFSRIAFRAILLPCMFVFCLYFLLKGFDKILAKRDSARDFIISAIFFSAGFYTYTTFKLSALVIPAILLLMVYLLSKKTRIKLLESVFAYVLVGVLVAMPLIMYFLGATNTPDRASQVFVFSQDNPVSAFAESIVMHLQMFNVVGDINWRHNISTNAQLIWPVGLLFLIGMILILNKIWLLFKKKIKSKEVLKAFPEIVLFLCFGAFILPSMLTYEGIPHALRSIGVIPFVYIISAYGAYFIVERIKLTTSYKKHPQDFNLYAYVFLGLLVFAQYGLYDYWAHRPEVESAFAHDYVELGRVLNDTVRDKNIETYIVLNNHNTTYEADSIKFIEFDQKNLVLAKQNKYHYITGDGLKDIRIPRDLPLLTVWFKSRSELSKTYDFGKLVESKLASKNGKDIGMVINFDNFSRELGERKEDIRTMLNLADKYSVTHILVILNSDKDILNKLNNR